MNNLKRFKEFSITKSEEKEVKGGFDWFQAGCNALYAGIAQSHLAGDKVASSEYFWAWVNAGC